MIKESDAKKRQNYREKPLGIRCMICKHVKSDEEKNNCGYIEEKNIRCGIGGFKVTPHAVCYMFEHKYV